MTIPKAVIFINKSTAINHIKPEYRVGQMKGDKAFSMFLNVKSVTGIIFQGNEIGTSFPISYLAELQAVEA